MKTLNLLPKFGPAKAAEVGPAVAPVAANDRGSTAPQAERRGGPGMKLRAIYERALTRLKRWFAWRPRNPFGNTEAKPIEMKQTELSLDGVKVLRNDLSDSDLEVVVVQQARKPERSKEPTMAQKTQPEMVLAGAQSANGQASD